MISSQISCVAPSSPKCMRPGPITSNGYLNFLREFRQKQCGLSAVETVQKGAAAWRKLTCSQKRKYILMGCNKRRTKFRASQRGCARKQRARTRSRSCRPRRVKRRSRSRCRSKARRPRSRSGCRSRSRVRSGCRRRPKRSKRCGSRRRRPKSRSRSKRRNGCRRPSRQRRRSSKSKRKGCPRMRTASRKRSQCRRRRSPAKRQKARCMRPGPPTSNPYLNFLRYFRRTNCGMSPTETVKCGARAWGKLPPEQRARFQRQACKLSKSKRTRKKGLCRRLLMGKGKRGRRARKAKRCITKPRLC